MLFRRNRKNSFEFKFDSEEYVRELDSFGNIPLLSQRKLKLCRNLLAVLFPVGIIAGYLAREFRAVLAALLLLTVVLQVSYALYRRKKGNISSADKVDLIAITEACIAAGFAGGSLLLPMAAAIARKYI